MRAIVPFKAHDPKSRLSAILSPPERKEFARTMLLHVLECLDGMDALIVSTSPISVDGARVEVDRRDLSSAINSRIEGECMVIMSDLPLLTREEIHRMTSMKSDLVLAPGRRGGTNAIVVRTEKFRTDYRGTSILNHIKIAMECGISPSIYESFRTFCDMDEPQDLADLMVYGNGPPMEYLKSLGIELMGGKICRRK